MNVVELIVDVNRERPVFRIEVTGLCCVGYRLTLHRKHCAVDGNHRVGCKVGDIVNEIVLEACREDIIGGKEQWDDVDNGERFLNPVQ